MDILTLILIIISPIAIWYAIVFFVKHIGMGHNNFENFYEMKIIKEWILFVFMCRFFLYKRTFHFQPFIYVDNEGNVLKNEIGNVIKWLDTDYIIKEYCSKNAMKIARKRVSKIYDGDLDDIFYF